MTETIIHETSLKLNVFNKKDRHSPIKNSSLTTVKAYDGAFLLKR